MPSLTISIICSISSTDISEEITMTSFGNVGSSGSVAFFWALLFSLALPFPPLPKPHITPLNWWRRFGSHQKCSAISAMQRFFKFLFARAVSQTDSSYINEVVVIVVCFHVGHQLLARDLSVVGCRWRSRRRWTLPWMLLLSQSTKLTWTRVVLPSIYMRTLHLRFRTSHRRNVFGEPSLNYNKVSAYQREWRLTTQLCSTNFDHPILITSSCVKRQLQIPWLMVVRPKCLCRCFQRLPAVRNVQQCAAIVFPAMEQRLEESPKRANNNGEYTRSTEYVLVICPLEEKQS